MRYDPDIRHRRSLRLKGWDYSSTGAYFITICAWKKECIFTHKELKQIACDAWERIPRDNPGIHLDEFVLMPNHLHGIIWVDGNVKNSAPEKAEQAAPLLGKIIRAFKSKAALLINRYRNTSGAPIWQRNFYEHIIRNENELNAIRTYIKENPSKWAEDDENPDNANPGNKK